MEFLELELCSRTLGQLRCSLEKFLQFRWIFFDNLLSTSCDVDRIFNIFFVFLLGYLRSHSFPFLMPNRHLLMSFIYKIETFLNIFELFHSYIFDFFAFDSFQEREQLPAHIPFANLHLNMILLCIGVDPYFCYLFMPHSIADKPHLFGSNSKRSIPFKQVFDSIDDGTADALTFRLISNNIFKSALKVFEVELSAVRYVAAESVCSVIGEI